MKLAVNLHRRSISRQFPFPLKLNIGVVLQSSSTTQKSTTQKSASRMDRGDGSVELKFRETFVDERRSGLGTVEQYPVVLCFAMSLSKAQVTEILWDESMLLSLVATIKDGESPIAGGWYDCHAAAYVGLSRIIQANKLREMSYLTVGDVKVKIPITLDAFNNISSKMKEFEDKEMIRQVRQLKEREVGVQT